MLNLVARFAKDESGSAVIEYGLIASLIGIAIIVAATALGNSLQTAFLELPAYGSLR